MSLSKWSPLLTGPVNTACLTVCTGGTREDRGQKSEVGGQRTDLPATLSLARRAGGRGQPPAHRGLRPGGRSEVGRRGKRHGETRVQQKPDPDIFRYRKGHRPRETNCGLIHSRSSRRNPVWHGPQDIPHEQSRHPTGQNCKEIGANQGDDP